MGKIEKLINKMIRKPKGITFAEIKKVLEHAGYSEVRVRGSHYHYRNAQGLLTTVKSENPEAVGDALEWLGK
ncbi:type II toxin-antitoxin system HicA family toxin [Paenibacillus luteus]|uniref:type II toxin-antitoxin system HicA family toxin n=1 Tax=Paenibacillus luteus TaxID=2545753 RepID=UPI001142E8A4|nr:type II toxin-antitoxin system HicA family toxin [Paenibacillus luteus]